MTLATLEEERKRAREVIKLSLAQIKPDDEYISDALAWEFETLIINDKTCRVIDGILEQFHHLTGCDVGVTLKDFYSSNQEHPVYLAAVSRLGQCISEAIQGMKDDLTSNSYAPRNSTPAKNARMLAEAEGASRLLSRLERIWLDFCGMRGGDK
jgi:hypothetical protein